MMEQPKATDGKFKKEFGDGGELMAESYLMKKGYRLLARKYRTYWGEIDLVMEDGRHLVFVEVKRRSNLRYGEPEESILPMKISHMCRAALQFVQNMGTGGRMMRFDVVCISGDDIRHYPNAFESTGEYWF